APDDGASASRMPPDTRPMISWTHRGAAFFLVEWQFGMPGGKDWEGSGFAFVPAKAAATQGGQASVNSRIAGGFGRSAIAVMWRAAAGGRSSLRIDCGGGLRTQ